MFIFLLPSGFILMYTMCSCYMKIWVIFTIFSVFEGISAVWNTWFSVENLLGKQFSCTWKTWKYQGISSHMIVRHPDNEEVAKPLAKPLTTICGPLIMMWRMWFSDIRRCGCHFSDIRGNADDPRRRMWRTLLILTLPPHRLSPQNLFKNFFLLILSKKKEKNSFWYKNFFLDLNIKFFENLKTPKIFIIRAAASIFAPSG